MLKGEKPNYLITDNDVQELDSKIYNIERSTRATFPWMIPLHDILRQKFHWYYVWSAWRGSKVLNIVILLLYLAGVSYFLRNFFLTS